MKDFFYIILNFIVIHKFFSYTILFMCVFFDALFPISFFIYGEFFFLTGGILAGLGILDIYVVSILFYIGGILGDNVSYFLGYKYGERLLDRLLKNNFFKRLFKKNGKDELLKTFENKGGINIFFTRIGGPITRIAPFVIGSIKYKYFKFLRYNIPGAIFGISIFISIGYFVGTNYTNISNYIYNYIFLFLLIIINTIITYSYLIKYLKLHRYINFGLIRNIFKRSFLKKFLKHIIIFSSILISIYALFLYLLFFYKPANLDNHYFAFENNIIDLQSIKNLNLNTYFFGRTSKIVQPINFIIITKKDINQILTNLGWEENKIILKDKISFKEYLALYGEKTLPITNLEFLGKNQDFGYQMSSNSNQKRIHLRGWNYGKYNDSYVYFITISNDEEYDIDLYNNFITPIHEIDKNIDKSRNFLLEQLESKYKENIKIEKITTNPVKNKTFSTDGIIYVFEI